MLMYTSCGWFFDEISGIETVQVIQYAGRVIQLARVSSARFRRGGIPGAARAGPEQPAGARERPPHLRKVREAGHGGPETGRSPLRGQLPFRELRRPREDLLLRREPRGFPCPHIRRDEARPGEGAGHLEDHAGHFPPVVRRPVPWGPQRQRRDPRVPGRGGIRGPRPGDGGGLQEGRPAGDNTRHGRAFRPGDLLPEAAVPRRAAQDHAHHPRPDPLRRRRRATGRSTTSTPP